MNGNVLYQFNDNPVLTNVFIVLIVSVLALLIIQMLCARFDCPSLVETFYGSIHTFPQSCIKSKQIYLNSDGCDEESTAHADVNMENRFGKIFLNINANLPNVKGGDFQTAYGAYHAFLVDKYRREPRVYLGQLVLHGDHFYKLVTELLGDYSNYNEILVIRKTEDYPAVKVLRGKIY